MGRRRCNSPFLALTTFLFLFSIAISATTSSATSEQEECSSDDGHCSTLAPLAPKVHTSLSSPTPLSGYFRRKMDGLETGVPHGLRAEASSAPSTRGRLRVMLIRHGESMNNVLYKTLEKERKAGIITLDTARERWFRERSFDPDITDKGVAEAEALASGIQERLRNEGCMLVCSPMKRAIRTAQAVAEAVGASAVVHPDFFEVGGIYGSRKEEGEGFQEAHGFSAAQMKSAFPFTDTRLLPKEGAWNKGLGKETVEGTRERAVRAAKWIRARETQELVRKEAREAGSSSTDQDPLLVVVAHSDFIDLLLKCLLFPEAGADKVPWNQFAFVTDNTSVSECVVPAEGEPGTPLLQYVNRMVGAPS